MSQLISLLVRGLPQMQDLLLTFSSLPRVQVPFHFLSSPFYLILFFHPT